MAQALSITELTRRIKNGLEEQFPHVEVIGEISNFRPAASGHWYFSVKDDGAVLQCVLFRGRRSSNTIPPKEGDTVLLSGAISVYPPRGSYQLVATTMQPVGRGHILAMLEARKEALAQEGLFDRSLPISSFPRSIVVITSPTGAAIRDVLNVLSRRRPDIEVRIVPVPVQGSTAGNKIAQGIRLANAHRLGETLLITRGGGSIEDLLPFSDEEVVRAIVASEIPIVSAVGHEIDWALSDFAADLRASTPSAAAELISLPTQELLGRISRASRECTTSYLHRVEELKNRLNQSSAGELRYRYRNFVQPWYQRLDEAQSKIRDGMFSRISDLKHRSELLQERLLASSPLAPLERGFALIRHVDTGEYITRASAVPTGIPLNARFIDGTIPIERITNE